MEELIANFKGLFSSPISTKPLNNGNKSITPTGISKTITNPVNIDPRKLVFGGKRKSLKRKNKKNNKTKRR